MLAAQRGGLINQSASLFLSTRKPSARTTPEPRAHGVSLPVQEHVEEKIKHSGLLTSFSETKGTAKLGLKSY